ncbi:hypothetical protein EYF80_015717 [Liparis tanakae]|uniref:Uncharacterized protein n=1 Tax=Liparis tanakae TaxID=230148 RepID=A0A4Z2I7Q7_9TELE|nr:hypothetical protein EYF80_015717 [Liparis tanakae]
MDAFCFFSRTEGHNLVTLRRMMPPLTSQFSTCSMAECSSARAGTTSRPFFTLHRSSMENRGGCSIRSAKHDHDETPSHVPGNHLLSSQLLLELLKETGRGGGRKEIRKEERYWVWWSRVGRTYLLVG